MICNLVLFLFGFLLFVCFHPGYFRILFVSDKNRDFSAKFEDEQALTAASTFYTHVQKPLSNLDACAQSKGNPDFLFRPEELLITADRKHTGSGDEMCGHKIAWTSFKAAHNDSSIFNSTTFQLML